MTEELKLHKEKTKEEHDIDSTDYSDFHQEAMAPDELDGNKKRKPLINGFLFLGKAFWSQWRVLMSVTVIFTAIILVISLLTWGVDWSTTGDNFNISNDVEGHSHHLTFFESLWWVFITISTIGFGDVYPVTDIMKVWAMFIGIIGIVFVSLYTAIVVNGFSIEMQRNLERRRERRDQLHRKHEQQTLAKELRKQLKAKQQEIDELMFAIVTFSGKSEEEIQETLKEARLNVKKELITPKTKTKKTKTSTTKKKATK